MSYLTRLYFTVVAVCIVMTGAYQMSCAQSPSDIGVRDGQSYDGTKESIGLANGNLNIEICPIRLSGRGNTQLKLCMDYNSSTWSPAAVHEYGQSYWSLIHRPGGLDITGWQLAWPSINSDSFDAGDGASHTYSGATSLSTGGFYLPWVEQSFISLNGTNWYVQDDQYDHSILQTSILAQLPNLDGSLDEVITNKRVLFPDGSQFRPGSLDASLNTDTPPNNTSQWTAIDKDGNTTTYTVDPPPASPYGNTTQTVMDNTGRVITIVSAVDSSGANSATASYLDDYGVTRNVQLIFSAPAALETTPTFTYPSVAGVKPIISPYYPVAEALTAIILPNGATYTFSYNPYGELTKITYPTGGYTRYDYQAFTNTIDIEEVYIVAPPFPGTAPTIGDIPALSLSDYRQVVAKHECTGLASAFGATVQVTGNNCPVPELTTTYSPSVLQADGGNESNTIVYPDGTSVEHDFVHSAPGDCRSSLPIVAYRCAALDTGTITRDQGSNIISTTTTQYADPTCPVSPTQTTEMLGVNGLVKTVNTVYDHVQTVTLPPINQWQTNQYPPYIQVVDPPSTVSWCQPSDEYTYATIPGSSAPGLVSHHQYTWSSSQANGVTYGILPSDYVTPIRSSVKTGESIYDASGSLKSNTLYTYDQQSHGLVQSGAVQHGIPAVSYQYQYPISIQANGLAAQQGTTGTATISVPAFSYDSSFIARGNLTSKQQWRSTDGRYLTTTYNYDDAGNRLSVVDPAGNLTQYSYTDNFAQSSCAPSGGNAAAYITQITSPTGLITSSQYNSCTGHLATTKNPNQEVTSLSYDLYGRLATTQEPDGGIHATCYSDTPGGTCYSSSLPFTTTNTELIDNNNTLTHVTEVDGIKRTVLEGLTSDPYGADWQGTQYDNMSRKASVDVPYKGVPGQATGTAQTQYLYDSLGRLQTDINPSGGNIAASQRNYSYSPFQVISTDEIGTQVQRYYDGLGRLVAVCEPSNSSDTFANSTLTSTTQCNASNAETDYSYDALDNLVLIQQNNISGSMSRSFSYDSLSRLLQSNNPETGVMTYSYITNAGLPCAGDIALPCSITDAVGRVRTLTYDAENRLTQKTYSDGTPGASFTYGTQGGIAVMNHQVGRLVSENVNLGSTVLSSRAINLYDSVGRVLNETQCVYAVCNQIPYTYDYAGNLRSLGVGSTGNPLSQVSYSFDAANHLKKVSTNWNDASHPGVLYQATNFDTFGPTAANLAIAASSQQPAMTLALSHNIRGWISSGIYTGQVNTTQASFSSSQATISGSQPVSGTSSNVHTITTSLAAGLTSIPDYGAIGISNGGVPLAVSYSPQDTVQSITTRIAQSIGSTCTLEARGGPISQYFSAAVTAPNMVTLTDCPLNIPDNISIATYSSQQLQASLSGSSPQYTIAFATTPGTTTYSGTVVFSANGSSSTIALEVQNSSAIQIAQDLANEIGASCTLAPSGFLTGGEEAPASVFMTASVQIPGQVTLTDCTQQEAPDEIQLQILGSSQPNYQTNPTLDFAVAGQVPTYQGYVQLTLNGAVLTTAQYAAGSTASSIAFGLTGNFPALSVTSNNGLLTMTGNENTPANSQYGIVVVDESGASPFSVGPSTGAIPNGISTTTQGLGTLYSYDLTGLAAFSVSGQVKSVSDSMLGTWSYNYDQLNRLSSAQTYTPQYGITNIAWTYDLFGNRINVSANGNNGGVSLYQPTFTYTANNNRVDGYCYDGAGNVLSETGCQSINFYSYDAEERILSIGGSSFYIYDAEGRRVAKASGSSLATAQPNTIYILDPAGREVTEQDGSGSWRHTDVYGGDGVLATYDATGLHFYLHDWLGTRRAQANAQGLLEGLFPSLPYGEMISTPAGFPSVAAATEHQFTGKERDSESGLDYFGARYYNSSVGRFMSPDWGSEPMGVPYANYSDPQSLNLYTYMRNSPLDGIDRDGHCADGTASSNAPCPYPEAQPSEGEKAEAAYVAAQDLAQAKRDAARNAQQYGKQPDGSYKADPAAVKKAIAGGKAIGSGECVALCRFLSGAPNSSTWTAGQHAAGLTDADIGTAIATFDSTGHYPSDNDPLGKNSAIFMGRGTNGSIWVVDQWPVGDGPRGTHQPFLHEILNYAPDNSVHPLRSNNADAYYVIRVP